MRNVPYLRSSLLFLLAATLPLLAACQPAERGGPPGTVLDTAAVESGVESLRQAYVDAFNAGEAGELASLFTETGALLPADAPPAQGHEALRTYYEGQLAPGPTLEVEPHELTPITSGWASEGGEYRVTVTPEGADEPVVTEGSYLVLARRTADGWKLHRLAATLDALPAAGGP